MWREGLGAYKIITENKKGYRNHPAVKEFANAPQALWNRLFILRQEMLNRGYNPKELPFTPNEITDFKYSDIEEWQTLDEQIAVLKTKGCKCNI